MANRLGALDGGRQVNAADLRALGLAAGVRFAPSIPVPSMARSLRWQIQNMRERLDRLSALEAQRDAHRMARPAAIVSLREACAIHGVIQANKRAGRLARFGRRYAQAQCVRSNVDHDWRMQAVRVASRIVGSLSYHDITCIIQGFGDAEEEARRG